MLFTRSNLIGCPGILGHVMLTMAKSAKGFDKSMHIGHLASEDGAGDTLWFGKEKQRSSFKLIFVLWKNIGMCAKIS